MKTKININYIKVDSDISFRQRGKLGNIIKRHALIAGRILHIPFVTITIYPKSNWTIPETGENGYTPSGDWMQIYIDPKNKYHSFDFIANNIIPGTIYHEMNHVARWRAVGFGKSLIEAIISEGLASIFEREQWKRFTAPWANWEEKEIINFINIFRKRDRKKDTAYNHSEWFFGKGKLPRWIGYKLGAYIVESARKNYPKISWHKLTAMEASDIIEKSGVKM
jgi:uncharacterized protein YjaZ